MSRSGSYRSFIFGINVSIKKMSMAQYISATIYGTRRRYNYIKQYSYVLRLNSLIARFRGQAAVMVYIKLYLREGHQPREEIRFILIYYAQKIPKSMLAVILKQLLRSILIAYLNLNSPLIKYTPAHIIFKYTSVRE